MERIQKIMAHSGVASRRKCEDMIEKGLVKLNGKTVKLGDKADKGDRITVNGKLLKLEKKTYVIMNKPKGIICSVGDFRGRKSVVDLVKCKERVFPVGRLDMDSEGLIILTNDGDFANDVIHPRNNVKKAYSVLLDKVLDKEDFLRIKSGVEIDGKKVTVFDFRSDRNAVELSIHEGRKHIIKRLFGVLGYKVNELKRIAIGGLKLNLDIGEYRFVSGEWLRKNIFLRGKNQKLFKE